MNQKKTDWLIRAVSENLSGLTHYAMVFIEDKERAKKIALYSLRVTDQYSIHELKDYTPEIFYRECRDLCMLESQNPVSMKETPFGLMSWQEIEILKLKYQLGMDWDQITLITEQKLSDVKKTHMAALKKVQMGHQALSTDQLLKMWFAKKERIKFEPDVQVNHLKRSLWSNFFLYRFLTSRTFLASGLPLLILFMLITAGGTYKFAEAREVALVRSASQSMERLGFAIEEYKRGCGKYPETLDDLANSVEDCNKGASLSFLTHIPLDPWSNAYSYSFFEGRPMIMSYGKDNKEGGEGVNQDLVYQVP